MNTLEVPSLANNQMNRATGSWWPLGRSGEQAERGDH
jgi:hypothetical protein